MAVLVIPRANWTRHLADAIDQAEPGDTISVDTEDKAALARSAKAWMCPDKPVYIEVDPDAGAGKSQQFIVGSVPTWVVWGAAERMGVELEIRLAPVEKLRWASSRRSNIICAADYRSSDGQQLLRYMVAINEGLYVPWCNSVVLGEAGDLDDAIQLCQAHHDQRNAATTVEVDALIAAAPDLLAVCRTLADSLTEIADEVQKVGLRSRTSYLTQKAAELRAAVVKATRTPETESKGDDRV